MQNIGGDTGNAVNLRYCLKSMLLGDFNDSEIHAALILSVQSGDM